MAEKKLSEKLKFWRAERPDEWTMDEFIRDSIKLEQTNKELTESHFYNVNSRIEKRSELMEKLYNTYIINVDEDSGMPKASVMELVKLHEECDDVLYGC